jgi:hypothetical protein
LSLERNGYDSSLHNPAKEDQGTSCPKNRNWAIIDTLRLKVENFEIRFNIVHAIYAPEYGLLISEEFIRSYLLF